MTMKCIPKLLPMVTALAMSTHLFAATPSGGPQTLTSPDQVPDGLAKSDWTSIRAAYEAGRHAFQPVEGGWQARNPGQQWLTNFDGRGFVAQPNDNAWQWGLELMSYGFSGNERAFSGVPTVTAVGQRLTYQWAAGVQEWFVNDPRGLEHGFTLTERPSELQITNYKFQISDREPQLSNPLAFTLAVRGDLRPALTGDAQGVRFLDGHGATVLTYSGLKAWDADGKTLPSRFETAGAGVRLLVDERGARYPLTIDPIAQQAYLKAENTGAGDAFGYSVAVSGDTVVVGAPWKDGTGAAFVFVRSGTTWTQQAYLKASNAGAGDMFGYSVAISGDTVVIGARSEDSSTTGVNSTPNDSASNSGAAYVFVRSGTAWTQQAYLKAHNTGAGDEFGAYSVSVSGDTVVVGAVYEDSSTVGVNSTSNDSATDSGAAYVFVRSGTTWTQQAYLKASNTGVADGFGYSVSVSGDTVVAGAAWEDSSAAGVNSTPNENASDSGAAYVFVRSGTTWTEQAYLKASNTGAGDWFAFRVAISGDTVVVGAPTEDSGTTGVDSVPNENASDSGAAYVFVRKGTAWTQDAYLKASNTGADDTFGIDTAIEGNTVVVGARQESSSSTGVNSTPNENAAASGAAYVFVRSRATWTQLAYLKPGNPGSLDYFGGSVAVSGDTVIVGAHCEDSSTTGVNSTPNDSAPDSGAAYVFTGLGPSAPTYYWQNFAGLPGTAGSADGTGSAARFNYPVGLALDRSGNLFVADELNHTIRKVSPTGTVSAFAGAVGQSGSADGTGSDARFNLPMGLVMDAQDNLFVADYGNYTIRRITPAGVVTTVAGSPGASGSIDGTGAAARFNRPFGIAADAAGNLFVTDGSNHTIRKVTTDAVVTTLAGSAGATGSANGTGAAARFYYPMGVSVGPTGDLYVADSHNHLIRKVTQAGVTTTVAGIAGSVGDLDGDLSVAKFNYPTGVVADGAGNLFVANYDGRTIRMISPAGMVTTLGGLAAISGSADGVGSAARFGGPRFITLDVAGNLFVADDSAHRISRGVPMSSALIDGLVAHYSFNGNAQDGSGHNHHGTVNGAVLTNSRFNEVDHAYSFDGQSSHIDLPSLYSYNPTYLTINAWIKLNTLGTRKMIVAKLTGGDTSGNFGLEIYNDVISMGLNKDGTWHQALGTTRLVANVWYQITATYDGSYLRVFLDGIQDGSLSYTGGMGVNTIPWMIGVHPSQGGGFFPGFSFNGAIDDIRIYDRALAVGEIQALYNLNPADPPTITTISPLASGMVGRSYSQSLTATGGAAPYGWSLASGTLPDGLSLSEAGVITGTPTAAGSATFTVRVTGSDTGSATKEITLAIIDPAALRSGSVAWWRGEDNFQDSAGTNHGTGVNGASLAAGKVGKTMTFDGVNDYVQVPGSPSLNLVSGQGWTLEGWILVNNISNSPMIAHRGTGNGGNPGPYWDFYVRNDNARLHFITNTGGSWGNYDSVHSATTVTPGVWQHVAIIVDNMGGATSAYHFYINGIDAGVSYSEDWTTSGTVTTTEPLCIGSLWGQYQFFDGLIDELAIYNRALTPAEISAIHAAGSAGKVGVPPTITTASPFPPGIVGGSYSQTLTATGGTAPYTWEIVSGTLPDGLSLSEAGELTGTPTAAGSTTFTVRVTGSDTGTASKDFSITIFPQEGAPVISNLTAAQRPGTKLVDIGYSVTAATQTVRVTVAISSDGGATWAVPATSATGDIGSAVAIGTDKTIVWDAGVDWNGNQSGQLRYRITAEVVPQQPAPGGFAQIPAGSFQMGDALDGMTDAPVHTVAVSAVMIGNTEVTKAQWDAVREWGIANGYSDLPPGSSWGANHPVHTINWYGAVKWCNARSEMENRTPCYTVSGTTYKTGNSDAVTCSWTANGYRLPTEAEWEKAARGGVTGKRFPWGDIITHNEASYENDGGEPYQSGTTGHHPTYGAATAPVGSFAANGYGLFDMAGNMFEWCWDWYGSAYFPTSPGADPRGPTTGTNRLFKSGSWGSSASNSRCATRNNMSPTDSHYKSGLRLAMSGVSVSGASTSLATADTSLDTRAVTPVGLPSGCVAWWRGEGNFLDSVGPHHGTGMGGAAFATGEVGQSMSFDGTDDFVTSNALNLPGVFTIECWVKPSGTGTGQLILAKGGGDSSRCYELGIEGGGRLFGTVRSGGGFTQYRSVQPVIIADTWQHVCLIYDTSKGAGEKMQIFIGGASVPVAIVGSYDAGGVPNNNSHSLKIGIYSDGVAAPINGLIDELAIYDRALTPAEISAIHTAGGAGKVGVVGVAPTITTASPLPVGTAGVGYSQTLAATGGSTPYTWSVAAGPLPDGLNLAADGVLSGTPMVAGTFNFTARVAGADGSSAMAEFGLTLGQGTATITLGDLAAVYNGSPKSASATTNPAGLPVRLTYDGSATPPQNVGSYPVEAVIEGGHFTGSATGTLVIGKGTATVTLDGLTAVCDGTAKAVTATTSPAGLTVQVTYDGSSTPPSALGSYAVSASIDDVNYTGTATGTLTLGIGPVTFSPDPALTYVNAVDVTLACVTPGVEIRYTTDGSVPAAGSNLASGPLQLTRTTRLRAAAFATGGNSGPVAEATYLVGLPPVTSGLKIQFDAQAITGLADGDTINTWNDTSGNANHGTSGAIGAAKPIYKVGVLNGQPVVRFNPDGLSYFTFANRLTTIRTVFVVAKQNATGSRRHLLLGDSTSYDFHAGSGGEFWDANYSSASVQGGTTRLNGEVINGTTTSMGTSWFSLSLVTTGNARANALGNDRNINDGRFWDGDMAEVLIYNRALSEVEVSEVADYLNAKWFNSLKTVATPVISPAGGTHTAAVEVTLTTATAGATLYYTTDGGIPDETSSVYGGAFTLGADATVKARAYKAGFNPSGVASTSYHIDAQPPVVTRFAWQNGVLNNGATFTDKGVFSVMATDNEGVAAAEFYYKPSGSTVAQLVGRDATPADGLSAAWDIATIADGAYTVVARVYDISGAWAEVSRTISVALALPAAPVITGPASGLTVLDSAMTITGTAEPNASIRLYRGATEVYSGYASAAGAFSHAAALPDGTSVFKAVAVNRAGSSPDSNTVSITRLREFPQLALTFSDNTLTESVQVTGTVHLPAAATTAVTVQLSTNKASQVESIAPVVIPAGATSGDFMLSARQDTEIELLTTLVVSATAPEHQGAQAELFLGDDDYPGLELRLDTASVAENHGTVVGVIRRNPVTDRAVRVLIRNSNPAEATTPAFVDIPASQAEASFAISVVDDTADDDNQNVELRGVVVIGETTVAQSEAVVLEVRDNEGPGLTLTVANPYLSEGGAVNAQVARAGGSSAAPLVVALAQTPVGQLVLPATVTIPAGQEAAGFVISAVANSPVAGTRGIAVAATAAGFTDGRCQLTLTDVANAELTVGDLAAPAQALTEAYAAVDYRVSNLGAVAVTDRFFERIFLSRDLSPSADDLLVRQMEATGEVAAGGGYGRHVTVLMPAGTGIFYLIVTVDPGNLVPELNEENNTTVLTQPIEVLPAYSATVAAADEVLPANTPVALTGSATRPDATPAAYAMVNIHLKVNGTTRTFSAVTNALGRFATTWTPLANEGGTYTIAAGHPGAAVPAPQDAFEILTLGFSPPAAVGMNEGETKVVEATLRNPNTRTLHGIAMTVSGVPSGLTITPAVPATTLDAGAEMKVPVTVSANSGFSGSGAFALTVTTSEGVTMRGSLQVGISLLTPSLAFNVGTLDASVLCGGSKSVSFTISNTGGLATGPVGVLLPSVPWLSLASASPLPSIPPGGSASVSLQLAPDATVALTLHTGSIAINPTNGNGRTLPYQFRTVSSSKGDLAVEVVDELFFFTTGSPKLAGADVTIRDAISSSEVARATTGVDGRAAFPSLDEGWYRIEVSAAEHDGYGGNFYVNPGEANFKQVFISKQLVKYSWVVEEVEIEDTYRVTVETKFETNVPAPVVTVTPSALEVGDLVVLGQSKIINVTLENHGLIAAEHTLFRFSEHPFYTFTPLVDNIGTIPAKSSLVVPVTVRRIGIYGDDGEIITENDATRGTKSARAPRGPRDNSSVPCGAAGSVDYDYRCGDWSVFQRAIVLINGVVSRCVTPGARVYAANLFEFFKQGNGDPNDLLGGEDSPYSKGIVVSANSVYVATPDYTCFNACILKATLDLIPLFEAIEGVVETTVDIAEFVQSHVSGGGERQQPLLFLHGQMETSTVDDMLEEYPNAGKVAKTLNTAVSWIHCFAVNPNPHTAGSQRAPKSDSDPFAFTDEARNFAPALSEAWDRCAPMLRMHALIYGSHEMVLAYQTEPGRQVAEAFSTAISETSPGERTITAHESTTILELAIPAGLDQSVVTRAIARWNRTVEYYGREILEIAHVPAGESTDFVTDSSVLAAAEAFLTAVEMSRNRGFIDPQEEFAVEADKLRQTLEGGQGGTCATVKIQLSQDAVMTRTAFRATLVLENERTDGPVTGVGFDLQIRDEQGQPAEDLFNVQVTKLTGLGAIDGTGEIPSASTGSVQWTLIPRDTAALEAIRRYTVGGVIHYVQNGSEFNIPVEDMTITVRPDAALAVKYFHQRDVLGDDPHTDEIEPAVPYMLAALVENKGFGDARNLRIISGQPQIVDNEKGLFIDYKVVGSEVDGTPLSSSLAADFGTLTPGQKKTAIWYLTSSLQGLFTDYQATFEHVTGLGDSRISLLKEVEIHEMIRMVRAQGAIDDGKPDFLTNDASDANDFPDTIHFSHGGSELVTLRQTGTFSGLPGPGQLGITLTTGAFGGWAYVRLPDPGKGRYRLVSATRGDGRVLPLDSNVWQSDRTFIGNGRMPIYENILHLVDNDSAGTYTLVFEALPTPDSTVPISHVNILPALSEADIPVTWSGTDDQAVAHFDVYVAADGGAYSLWRQRTAETGGLFSGSMGTTYRFYSVATDRSGNREPKEATAEATTQVGITNQPPVLAGLADAAIDEGGEFTAQATATDPDGPASAIRFAVSSDRAGVVIDPVSGVLRWNTNEADGGTVAHVSVTATDAGNPAAAAVLAFTLTVNEVNRPPTLASVASQTLAVGGVLIVDADAADGDWPAQTLTYALATAPAGAMIDPSTGVVQWSPAAAQAGATHPFVVTATDNGSPHLAATVEFSVTVLKPADRPPVFNRVPVVLWLKGKTYELTVAAADPDGDPISLTANTSAAAGAAFSDRGNGVGALSWNTTGADAGTYEVPVTATAGELSTQATVRIKLANDELYWQWAKDVFGELPAGSDFSRLAMDADPDGDGRANVHEMAFLTNPLAKDDATIRCEVFRSKPFTVTKLNLHRRTGSDRYVEFDLARSLDLAQPWEQVNRWDWDALIDGNGDDDGRPETEEMDFYLFELYPDGTPARKFYRVESATK